MRMNAPDMRRARIEIIPMIDTIFFLLVFFMITWLSMVKMHGLGMALPHRVSPGGKAPTSVVLSLSPAGTYFLDGHRAPTSAWAARLQDRLAGHPDAVVVVNVAATQNTQTLISVLDTVNGAISASHSRAQVIVATPRVSAPSLQEAPHGIR